MSNGPIPYGATALTVDPFAALKEGQARRKQQKAEKESRALEMAAMIEQADSSTMFGKDFYKAEEWAKHLTDNLDEFASSTEGMIKFQQATQRLTNFIDGAETDVALNASEWASILFPDDVNEEGEQVVDLTGPEGADQELIPPTAASGAGLMSRPTTTEEVETPAVEAATEETTEDTTITDLVYNDFVEGKQEGDEAHVGQDNKNITLAGGVVPDGLKYDGKDFEQDKSPVVGFDKTKLDTSGAYKKVGTVTVKRSDFDSDKAFAKGVIAEFAKQAETAAGTNWSDMSEGSKKAVVKIGWNKGAGWYTGNTAKSVYKELAKDKPNPDNLYSKILAGSTVKGGGASIGIAKARANAWNETISATGGKEITRIDADNSGTNTAFKYYDKDGNLLHTEQTSRASTIYENRLQSVSKNSKGVW